MTKTPTRHPDGLIMESYNDQAIAEYHLPRDLIDVLCTHYLSVKQQSGETEATLAGLLNASTPHRPDPASPDGASLSAPS